MKNQKLEIIKIMMRSGEVITFRGYDDKLDDYAYDCKVYVVKKNGAWVGIYNMDCISYIVIE